MSLNIKLKEITCEKEDFEMAFYYLKTHNAKIDSTQKSVKKIVLWIIELAEEFWIETNDVLLIEKIYNSLLTSWNLEYYWLAKKVEEILNNNDTLEDTLWRKKIENIDEDNIVPFYQEIINNEKFGNKEIKKFEALMRFYDWENYYPPWLFLHLINNPRRLKEITYIMIKKVIQEMSKHEHSFSINITEHDLENIWFVEYILTQLSENKVDSNRLTLEILEDISLCNNTVIEKIKKLRQSKIKIAIDDFWTWYSNFQRVCLVKPDFLKLDWSIVNWCDWEISEPSILKAIIDFSHSIWAKVVAEHVEDQEKQDELTDMWVEYSQWFHFSKPVQYI